MRILTAARRFRAEGRLVQICMAPFNMDFNDVLKDEGRIATPIRSLAEFEAETLAMLKPAFKSRYGMLTWAELDNPGPELEWLIDDLLTVGDKSIIGGPSQSGKSFLAIDAGMSIALGKPFLGHEVRKGLVIYQAGEGARGIKNRLRAYRKHFGIDPKANVPFVMLQSRVDLFAEDGDTAG